MANAALPSPSPAPPLPTNITHTMDPQNLYTLYTEQLRSSQPPLPPYLAAVRTLTAALSQSEQPLHTLAETLALLSSLSSGLKKTLPVATAIAISAGTDTFQRQVANTLARGQPDAPQSDGADTRSAVIKAGESFIQRHLAQRTQVADYGPLFIQPGMTLVVPSSSPSRNVDGMLRAAADADVHFRVILVREEDTPGSQPKPTSVDGQKLCEYLGQSETPTRVVSAASLAQALGGETDGTRERQLYPPTKMVVLADAAALLACGGVLASLETHTAAAVAKALGRQVWIVGETGKIVQDMGIRVQESRDRGDESSAASKEYALDVTPADMITGILTEGGPRSTVYIAEEAVKLWF